MKMKFRGTRGESEAEIPTIPDAIPNKAGTARMTKTSQLLPKIADVLRVKMPDEN